jgi:stage II sporulation protein D
LRHDLGGVDLSGLGLSIAPPSNVITVGAPDMNLRKAKITRRRAGLWLVRWDGEKHVRRIESERLAVRGQMLRLGVDPAPRGLELRPSARGRGIDVIARLDLESYLMGVLPAEMPAVWPLEALKAQAVAARSFALRSAHDRRNRDFDVDSTVMDQVYKFIRASESHPSWKERVRTAVRETRGEVLTDSHRRVLKAFYSADCGCQTEDPKFVWGHIDAFVSVKDPSCKKHAPVTWRLTLKREDVRRRLVAALKLPADTGLKTLLVGGRTPSGRVARVVASMEVDGESRTVAMNSQEFRRVFGFDRVRSTDFSLRWLGRQLQIHGTGIGHGVGMCQTGARELAEEGMSYRDILKLYYPKANLWTINQI